MLNDVQAFEFTDKIMPCVLDSQATKVYKLKPDETKLVSAIVAVAVNIYMCGACDVCTLDNVDYVLTNDLKAMIKALKCNKTQLVSKPVTSVAANVIDVNSCTTQMIEYNCINVSVNVQALTVARQKLFAVLVYSMWFYVHDYTCDYITVRLRKLATMNAFLKQELHAFADSVCISVQHKYDVVTTGLNTEVSCCDYDIVLQSGANVEGLKIQTYIVAVTELTAFLREQYLHDTFLYDVGCSVCGLCVCGLLYIPMHNKFLEQELLNAERRAVIGACKDCINTHNMSELVFSSAHLWLRHIDLKILYTPEVYNIIVKHGGFSTEKSTKVKREPVILQYITSKSHLAIATLYITPKALKLCQNLMRTYYSGQFNEKPVSGSTSVVRKSESSCKDGSVQFNVKPISDSTSVVRKTERSCRDVSAQCYKTVMYNDEKIQLPPPDIGFKDATR